MDWVQQRAEREKAINEAAPELWSDLCSAIEESVNSLRRLYQSPTPWSVDFQKVHENKAVVRLKRDRKVRECSFRFRPEAREIIVGVDIAKNKHCVTMDTDAEGRVSLIFQDHKLTADNVSRSILEPLFFGASD